MLKRLEAWATRYPALVAVAITIVVLLLTTPMVLIFVACTSTPRATAAELDLCKARAGWKLVAAAAGGALDPAPGSPRATLEAAEDALCALVPVTPTKDAGQ